MGVYEAREDGEATEIDVGWGDGGGEWGRAVVDGSYETGGEV